MNSSGGYTRYHHCTDTHKHIALKLLDSPTGLDLGNDQSKPRNTPKDYEKAGESSTQSVRKTLIDKNYAETSKIFTVKDIDGNEVLYRGKSGNTDKELSGFTNSPTNYMVNDANVPSNGYYVFIGAYNADYHSFTIVLHKSSNSNTFTFIDQYGTTTYTGQTLESHFLRYIEDWRNNFPMQLELYQLRNNNGNE